MPTENLRHLKLWAGWMASPVAWFVQMIVVYALADGACHGRRLPMLHLATAAGLLVAALGGWASWRWWRDGSSGTREALDRFMATQGLLCALLFSAIILAQWVTVIVLDPCPL